MPRKTSSPTDDAWARLIRTVLVGGNGRPEGEGWRTRHEFAKQANLSLTRASVILQERVTSGEFERKKGKTAGNWIHYFRPKL